MKPLQIIKNSSAIVFGNFLILLIFSVNFAERLPIKIYTSADGLGSSFVDYLMRDSRGFMWFCTRDGLSRFDGARFITYQIGDTNSPPAFDNQRNKRWNVLDYHNRRNVSV